MFFCSTCGSSSNPFYQFNQHILLGKHTICPEAVIFSDYALHFFNATLEEMKYPTALQESESDERMSSEVDEDKDEPQR